jgi:hypothetical protein
MNASQTVRSWGKYGFENKATPIYDDYYAQRNIPLQQQIRETPQDFSDLSAKQVPIPPTFQFLQSTLKEQFSSKENSQPKAFLSKVTREDAGGVKRLQNGSNEFEKLYYVESSRAKAFEEDIKCLRDVFKKATLEKEIIRKNYEEFIKKLEEEIRMLKQFELRYNSSENERDRLENEVNRYVMELRIYKEQGSSLNSSILLDEFKGKILRLNEEKIALLNNMDVYRQEINQLSNRITYIQNTDINVRDNLSKLIENLKDKNRKLEGDLRYALDNPPEDKYLINELKMKERKISDLNSQLDSLSETSCQKLESLTQQLEDQKLMVLKINQELMVLRERPPEVIEKIVQAPAQKCEECAKKDFTIKYLSEKNYNQEKQVIYHSPVKDVSAIVTRETPKISYRVLSPSRVVNERGYSQPSTVYKSSFAENSHHIKPIQSLNEKCNCNCANKRLTYHAVCGTPDISNRNTQNHCGAINSSVITQTTKYNSPTPYDMASAIPSNYNNLHNTNYTKPLNNNEYQLNTGIPQAIPTTIKSTFAQNADPIGSTNHYAKNSPKIYTINNDHSFQLNESNKQRDQSVYKPRPMSASPDINSSRFAKPSIFSVEKSVPNILQSKEYDSNINEEFTKRLELSQTMNEVPMGRFTLNKESQVPKEEDLMYMVNNPENTNEYDQDANGFNFRKESTAFNNGSNMNISLGQGYNNSSNIFKRNSVITSEARDQVGNKMGFNEYD